MDRLWVLDLVEAGIFMQVAKVKGKKNQQLTVRQPLNGLTTPKRKKKEKC